MTDSNADPPKTLSAAEESFRTFLETQNYPKSICWLIPGDVLVDRNRHYWVRKRKVAATRFAALRYSKGLERNLGVMLRAVCATEAETFASVFVPEDDTDRAVPLDGARIETLVSRRKACHLRREESAQVDDALVVEHPAQQGVGSVN